jgi:hypothetical protein
MTTLRKRDKKQEKLRSEEAAKRRKHMTEPIVLDGPQTREREKNAPAQGQGFVEAGGIAEEVPGERGGEEEERSYCCIGTFFNPAFK